MNKLSPEQEHKLVDFQVRCFEDLSINYTVSEIQPTLIRIPNKDGKLIPFEPWKSQERFIKWFLYAFEQPGKWQLTLPKLRQGGVTVQGLSVCLMMAILYENFSVTFLIKNGEDCAPLFDKLRAMYETLPPEFKKPLKRNNERALKFAHNDSSIRILEAGQSKAVTAKKGRSTNNSIVWVTEAAYIEWAAELARGLRGSVAVNGLMVWESTMDGPGNWFGKSVMAMNKETNLIEPNVWQRDQSLMLFLPMYENPEYVYPVGPNWKPMTDREEQLFKVCESPEHIQFRRKEIEAWTDENRTGLTAEEAVDREFPFELMDGLTESGREFFHTGILRGLMAYWRARKLKQAEFGLFRQPGHGVIFVAPSVGNEVTIWKLPEEGWNNRYIIVMDCGEGNTGGDLDCLYVFDLVESEVVARSCGRQGAAIQTRIAMLLGEKYSNAWITWDRSGLGADRLSHFVQANYPKLWSTKPVDNPLIETEYLGVRWNYYNRTDALGVLRASIEEQVWSVPDLEFFDECLSFGYKEKANGTKKAEGLENTDDRIMTLAVLAVVINHLPKPSRIVKVERGERYENKLQKLKRMGLQKNEGPQVAISGNYD